MAANTGVASDSYATGERHSQLLPLHGVAAMRYNPEVPPDSTEWLALDEQLRIRLVESYHRAAREKPPNHTAHAAFHVIVENQIAESLDSVVRAMARLMRQGLSRHEALHAVGSVVADHFFQAMSSHDKELGDNAQAGYDAAVEKLTAAGWKRKYGGR